MCITAYLCVNIQHELLHYYEVIDILAIFSDGIHSCYGAVNEVGFCWGTTMQDVAFTKYECIEHWLFWFLEEIITVKNLAPVGCGRGGRNKDSTQATDGQNRHHHHHHPPPPSSNSSKVYNFTLGRSTIWVRNRHIRYFSWKHVGYKTNKKLQYITINDIQIVSRG